MSSSTETRTVTIPARADHDGHHTVAVTLNWTCPTCGGPRGEVEPTISFDGSRRLHVDGWENPCGHVDSYEAVRVEAGVKDDYYDGWEDDHFEPDVPDACRTGGACPICNDPSGALTGAS